MYAFVLSPITWFGLVQWTNQLHVLGLSPIVWGLTSSTEWPRSIFMYFTSFRYVWPNGKIPHLAKSWRNLCSKQVDGPTFGPRTHPNMILENVDKGCIQTCPKSWAGVNPNEWHIHYLQKSNLMLNNLDRLYFGPNWFHCWFKQVQTWIHT